MSVASTASWAFGGGALSSLFAAWAWIENQPNSVIATVFIVVLAATFVCTLAYLGGRQTKVLQQERQTEPPQQEIEKADAPRYMTAYEVIRYLADDSVWGNETRQYVGADGMRKNILLEAQKEFKRIAEQQGGIHAAGRLHGAGPHIPILETSWMSATLNPFSLYNPEISETFPAVPNPDGIPIYKNVRILREDVERAWPRCSTIATRIPLLDLLHEAEAMSWSLRNRDVSQRFAHGLRQAAAEGAIEIWGRDLKEGWDQKSAPHIYSSERITPAYFKDHCIEVQQALAHQLNAYTRTSSAAGNEPRFFADLYVDRLQALEWLRSEGIRLRDTA